MNDILSRAWDALNTFKQAYPENWHDEDEQVLKDLTRADLRLSEVKLKWKSLTKEEVEKWDLPERPTVFEFAQFVEAKVKEKNE